MLPYIESRPTFNCMNRPKVSGECYVQHLGCFFKLVLLLAESVLIFVRRLAAVRSVQRVLVVPVHPFRCFPSKLSGSFPRAEVLDYVGLEHSDASFGQGVVVAVSDGLG